jgi:hypothetical protein
MAKMKKRTYFLDVIDRAEQLEAIIDHPISLDPIIQDRTVQRIAFNPCFMGRERRASSTNQFHLSSLLFHQAGFAQKRTCHFSWITTALFTQDPFFMFPPRYQPESRNEGQKKNT